MKIKKLLLVSILMLVTTMIGAQEKKMALGLSAQFLLLHGEDSIAATKSTNDQLIFKPLFAFMLSEKTELDIFLFFASRVEKVNNVITAQDEETVIGVGAGVFQHLLVSKIFDFSAGFEGMLRTTLNPQYYSFNRFEASLTLPVVLDIKFTDTIRFRIKHQVVSVYLITESAQITNASTVDKGTVLDIKSYHNGGPSIELGIMFWF